VLAVREGVGIRSVTIAPDHETDGHVKHEQLLARFKGADYGITADWKERLMLNARIALAGGIAQRRAAPRSVRAWHGESDRHAAIECLVAYLDGTGPGKILDAYLRAVHLEAEAMLGGPWWRAVEALATALLEKETIPGREAERIAWEAVKSAARGVRP
jgi:hypothetical protein